MRLRLVYPEIADVLDDEDSSEIAAEVFNGALYFRVENKNEETGEWGDDSADIPLLVSVRYKNDGTEAIALGFSADGSTETTQTLVTKTNGGRWRWKHFTVSGTARFNHEVFYNFEYADFYLQCDGLLRVSSVKIRRTDNDAELVWKASEEKADAVDGGQIVDASITATQIANATITAQQIANATITATQIANATITAAQIANATITGTQIANATITGTHIQDASITGTDIGSATITATNIANATITATQIANATITATQIANATVTGGNIASATITGSNIAAGTILAANIASGTITGTQIASSTITATNIQALTITATEIADLTITAGKISNATITGAKIASATITDSNIAASTITGGKIAAGTITAGNIQSGTITGGLIAAGTITAANLAANTITSQQLYLGAYGGIPYNVGEALLVSHFDGARPYETDYTGNLNGHRGQVGTVTGGVIFRPGRFGKGVQIAEATTNLCTNPSFETNLTGWTNDGNGDTLAQSTAQSFVGTTSCLMGNTTTGGNGLADYRVSLTNGQTYTGSVWIYIPSSAPTYTTAQVRWQTTGFATKATNNFLTLANSIRDQWFRVSLTWTADATATFIFQIFTVATPNAHQEYIDAVQIENKAYATPYADGSLGTAHSWSGTAHASTSSRTPAARLQYPASGNVNLSQGTFSCWYLLDEVGNVGFPALFDARVDANNLLVLHWAQANGTYKVYATSTSAGVVRDTSSGALTQTRGWHHVVMTWKSGALKVYVDGVQSGATANYAVPVGTVTNFDIGSRAGGSAQANTVIDDVCILPNVLTATEIRAIYDSNAPVIAEGNNAEWRVTNGAAEVWGNANGIFARNTSGAASFALLNADGVNSNLWGGASETLDSGDAMLGSNASGKSNLFWDASTGRLNFRGGTTTQIYIGTDGKLYGAGGNAGLEVNGFWIVPDSATFDPVRAYKFQNGATENGGTYGQQTGSFNAVRMMAKAVSGLDTEASIFAYGASGKVPTVGMVALHNNGSNFGQIDVSCATDGTATARVIAETTRFYGTIALGGTTTETISSNQNNIATTGISKFRYTASGANRNLTGFANGAEGKLIFVFNVGSSNNVVLMHQNASSSAANRIICDTGADISLTPGQNRILQYDSDSSRWRTIM